MSSECRVTLPAARRARLAGFTLIELMVAVAVVGTLAAVVYPSYQSSVLKAHRSDAKSALTEAAQRLERHYTETNTYADAQFCSSGPTCTAAVKVYSDFSENRYYAMTFALNSKGVNTYVAIATPQGAQTADACGSLTLDQAGVRGVFGGRESDPAKCW